MFLQFLYADNIVLVVFEVEKASKIAVCENVFIIVEFYFYPIVSTALIHLDKPESTK